MRGERWQDREVLPRGKQHHQMQIQDARCEGRLSSGEHPTTELCERGCAFRTERQPSLLTELYLKQECVCVCGAGGQYE